MNDRIKPMRQAVLAGDHKACRRPFPVGAEQAFRDPALSYSLRTALRFSAICDRETPVVEKDAEIVLQRTVIAVPEVCSDGEMDALRAKYFLHERGNVSNICPDYAGVIASGLDAVLSSIEGREGELYDVLRIEIAALYRLCDRYRTEARRVGNVAVAERLARLPREGARSFADALQMFRILHFSIWAEGEYHVIVGRLDQYLYPYLAADLAAGVLTRDSALELLEEFFVSFNLDSDLYPGMQQGDDGQSIVLGGCDAEGNDAYNLLSELCMTACGNLCLADPKINLRVSKNTPIERFTEATHLTAKGLGFPQYSNDDVVIPGLIALGYDPADAANYTVAACWEFIIPAKGMEIPNIAALFFPTAVHRALHASLASAPDFDSFLAAVKAEVTAEARRLTDSVQNLFILPAPFLSMMEGDCLQTGRDVSEGNLYNHYGIHGVGLSTAVDSLAAIRQFVFEEKTVSPAELIAAIDADFEGYTDLYATLRYADCKMGNGIEEVDELAKILLETFADSLKGIQNERGGIFRAGTGSAMFYLHANDSFATPDGRCAAEPYGTNYSPSLHVRNRGPLSVIRSFTLPDLTKTINGGPLTMEFHADSFLTEEGIRSVALLVKTFVEKGGHQLQLNAVDVEVLKDAQIHPENYRSLIVRVWGWSAYFVELSREYQDHVIRRQEFTP
ncbi:MAG: pyruvate formate-lyase [Clostridia bacterium]|nr:pyruvate formate-lyase [Clostridia bacterium]